MRYRLFAFLVSSFALVAQAKDPGIVAVLPLADAAVGKTQKVDPTAKLLLEEAIRTVAGDNLSPRGFTILTGENTLQVLADNGIDPDQACESSCALEAARELKAELLISGTVAFSEGWYTAFIRLFESTTGRQLGSVEAEGKTVRDVRKSFSELAPELFSRVPGGSTSPRREVRREATPQRVEPALTPAVAENKETQKNEPPEEVRRFAIGTGINGDRLPGAGMIYEVLFGKLALVLTTSLQLPMGAYNFGASGALGLRHRFSGPNKSGFYSYAAVHFGYAEFGEDADDTFSFGEGFHELEYQLRWGVTVLGGYEYRASESLSIRAGAGLSHSFTTNHLRDDFGDSDFEPIPFELTSFAAELAVAFHF